ncbi:MAG TPA: CoA transferase [Bryobacteraceae bacterium]|nr:CoA transferase [Bryobacteraceae bacterium]
MNAPPLEGITVLDFSHALAGPYCTMIMAAYGARVIKVESPDQGDIGRTWGPPFQGGMASYFLGLNSGKESLAIDLKTPEGLQISKDLAAKADILIENFRPGTLNRLGLDYASLSAANPRLIYVSVSGYGQTGPRRMEPAMDLIIQASSGLMSMQGTLSGETVRTGHSVADITAGMYALIGSLLALEARHRTGKGQFVDVAMQDALISTMAPSFAYFMGDGILPKPMGTRFKAIVPYRNFVCADREISIAVASDKLWEGFCRAIERPDLTNHPRFNSNPLRVVNRNELEPMLEEIFRAKPAAHWMEVLTREGTPCTLVRNLKEVAEDAQTEAREMMPEVPHATAGKVRVTGPPVKLSDTPGAITHGAPPLGADSAAVLRDLLGLSEAEIERLESAGVIKPAGQPV